MSQALDCRACPAEWTEEGIAVPILLDRETHRRHALLSARERRLAELEADLADERAQVQAAKLGLAVCFLFLFLGFVVLVGIGNAALHGQAAAMLR